MQYLHSDYYVSALYNVRKNLKIKQVETQFKREENNSNILNYFKHLMFFCIL